MRTLTIGIIALQGDVAEHQNMLHNALDNLGLKGNIIMIKHHGSVKSCDGIILTGGESTTLSSLLISEGINEEIIEAHNKRIPIMGTCAGMIVLAKEGDEQVKKTGQYLLSLMNIKVKRNIFGRQKDSFETEIDVKFLDRPYKGVFIRAPAIVEFGSTVTPLSYMNNVVVAAEEDNLLVLAFHPELTNDTRMHEYFLNKVLDLIENK
ncbi:pyridoxal 5'-phosphate synthase glutaminase subunit PdxT [Methanosalsum natronophilum]|nr:pyridoxal 5'-phosphate synthase glutaminase subunit PdxT [Methanosalsum natronophilum]MCS3923245.1 5'-phosphate synthase pdxT subunit [Methanosalsum natronophilum]